MGYFNKGYYTLSLQEAVCRGVATRPYDLAPNVKKLYLMSEYIERNYQNKFYAMGQNMTLALKNAYDSVLELYDVLVMPTMPFKAPKLPLRDVTLDGLCFVFPG